MAHERGLGKGLSALLGDAALQQQESSSLLLPISQVQPGLNQPRKHFDDDALHDLSDSIAEHGIIQPLTVRRLSSGYYQIIAGERRWRAAKLAGLTEVPAVIIEADDRKVMELGLIENLQREDLSPMEEAEGYHSLMEDYGLTQEELAKRMGKSRSAIANTLRLLALPKEVREFVEAGQLTPGHARAVLSVSGETAQIQLAQRIVSGELSVRQAESLSKRIADTAKAETAEKPTNTNDHIFYLKEVEKDLSSRFGRKVSISSGRKKGKLELEFYNSEDLDTLLELLSMVSSKKGDYVR
ncbi:MAG: stage 0 sporulation protein [Oscillospiraceae bacterium]|nr:stage 0 sporulation protein [Oscillospiraceae bacterium]